MHVSFMSHAFQHAHDIMTPCLTVHPVSSVGFELLEYTLECQLPNFGECWWDHVCLTIPPCLATEAVPPVDLGLSGVQWSGDMAGRQDL